MTEEKRSIRIDDLYQIVQIEDPQISPDGAWVAFVRVELDRMEDSYRRNIWVWRTDDSEAPRQLTRSGKDSTPRWSPDGNLLAFVSGRGDRPQIYVSRLGLLGGEPRAITQMRNGAVAPAWSPDSTQIAFLSSLRADERETEGESETEPPVDKLAAKHKKEREEEDERMRQDPYRMWRIPYRVGTAFLDERYAQVHVITVPPENADPNDEAFKPRRLTDVDANHGAPEWSVDGQWLYTSRQVEPDADEPFVKQGVYRIAVADGTTDLLTSDNYTCMAPLPSPDGRWLAYIRFPTGNHGDLEAIARLSILDLTSEDAAVRDLNLNLDRAPTAMDWARDGSSLYFGVTDRGDVTLHQANPDDGTVSTRSEGKRKVGAFSVSQAGAVAAVIHTAENPGELGWLPNGATEWQMVTDFNTRWLRDVIVQDVHEMWFKSPSGKDIQGWYMLPVGHEDGKKAPLALNIHGGPRAMWGASTETMWHEWQVHAARGYAVFFCNPRGGDGYGEAFQRDLHAAWGDVAMMDVLAGVDVLLEKGFVDEGRMAITGGSYGGYMTAWIVGHDHRFACAVSQRGVYNLVSFYGTSDVPVLISSDFSVEPWEDHALLWKHSPLAYAAQIKTPLLLIHAENDYRVPIEQAEQLFAWVRRATETPVEMMRYPRDGHELSRSGEPKHRVSRLERMVDWFDRYCMPSDQDTDTDVPEA